MNVWRELFDPESPETTGERWRGLAFESATVALALGFAWNWAFDMQHDTRVVAPLGLAQHLNVSWLFEPTWAVAMAVLVTALLLSAVTTRWKALYLLAVACFHLQYVARYSLGKTPHGSHFVGIALVALGLGALLFEPPLARRAARGFALLFYGISYTMAGLSKLLASGPASVDGLHLWLWISEKQVDALADQGSNGLNLVQEWLMQSRMLGTAVLAFGLLTELCAWLMWWRRPRPYVLLGLIGISFLANVILLATLAVPVERATTERTRARPAAFPARS